jgi:uncharacterized membrane protein
MEARIGRLLGLATLAAVALLAIGSLLLLATGHSPLDRAPSLDPGRLLADLAGLEPAGLLWLGLLLVVVTPAARVAAALVGYVGSAERGMALVSALILVVIAAGVAAGTAGA